MEVKTATNLKFGIVVMNYTMLAIVLQTVKKKPVVNCFMNIHLIGEAITE